MVKTKYKLGMLNLEYGACPSRKHFENQLQLSEIEFQCIFSSKIMFETFQQCILTCVSHNH